MTVSPVTPSALRSIPVELSTHPYPIVIGDGALGSLGAQVQAQGFKAGTKVLVVTNPVVNGHYGATPTCWRLTPGRTRRPRRQSP
jgi:hypothetical protein